jgi:hypothetical protein
MYLFKTFLGLFSLMMTLLLINAGYAAYNPSSDSSQIAYYRGQVQGNREAGGYQGGERRYEPYGEQGRGVEPYHGVEGYHGYPEGYRGYPEGYRGVYPEYNRGYQAPVVVPQQQPVYVVPPQTTTPPQAP